MANQAIKVLLTCQPFRTHVIPLAPLAAKLQERGCDVMLASPLKDDQIEAARHYRIEFMPAGEDWTADRDVQIELAEALIQEGNERFCEKLFGRYMAGLAFTMAEDVNVIVDDWKPDLIVHDCSEFGGYLVGEQRGIPTVSADNGLGRLVHELHDSTIRPTLNQVRAEMGLPPEPGGIPGSYEHFITPVPKEFLLDDLEIPGCISYGHVNPRRRGERIPRGVFASDRPKVYAMLGSSGWTVPEFGPIFEHANRVTIEALSSINVDAMIAVGQGNVEKYAELAGDNVKVVEYAAQVLALEQADLFVGHGGFGGLRESIAGGTPMVLLPHFADQPPNAAVVEATGLGVMINSLDATPATVMEAVGHILADPRTYRRYTQAVDRIRQATQNLMPNCVR